MATKGSYVGLKDFEGTPIEKSFVKDFTEAQPVSKAVEERVDSFIKAKGVKCSAKKKRCIAHLVAQGKSEESAWAICTASLGE